MATITSQTYWYLNLELPSGVKPLEQRVVVEPVDRTQDRLFGTIGTGFQLLRERTFRLLE